MTSLCDYWVLISSK